MCGICGMLRLNRGHEADRRLVEKMRQALSHRGPDDIGAYVTGPIGLGVTRLSIIDPTGGHQPVSNEDGTIWAIQNGEIYNYRELRRELLGSGHVLRSHSDTEVLVHLYEEHGERFLTRLRGMYALAVWDERKQRLLLARDRLGIKPLHYVEHEGTLYFASELGALLHAGLPRRIDPQALHDYLSFDFVPGPRTMFEDVRKLPAGHRLIQDEGLRLERYWDLPQPTQVVAPSDDERVLARMLHERLTESVRAHLVSDVEVGAFLSGGLDSSVVVALMAQLSGSTPATYSVGFQDESYNELPYARRVAQLYGTNHHEFTIEPTVGGLLGPLVEYFGEPFADSSAVAAYCVAEAAADHTKVVLSGDGGDEVFGGYVIYQADRLARYYRLLPESIGRRLIPAIVSLLPASEEKMSWDLKVRRFAENAWREPARAHGGWRAIFSQAMKDRLYSESYKAAQEERLDALRDSLDLFQDRFDDYPGEDLLNRFMYLDTSINLVDDMLTKVDRTSMAHGLEVRVPLLDHLLVEWMASVPSRHKVKGLTLKHLLKLVARELLPADVVERPKAGFHVPVPRWLKHELRPLVEQQLGVERVARQGVFDPGYVRSVLDSHYAGRENLSRNIWGLLMFSLWHDRFMDDA